MPWTWSLCSTMQRSDNKAGSVVGGSVGLLLGCMAQSIAPLQAQQANEVVVTPLLSTTTTATGQAIVLPQNEAQLLVSIYDIAPGAVLPEHQHPYPRYGYVLSGNLRVTDTETDQSRSYGPGDFILEAVGQWHLGANTGSEPIKLLIIDIVEKGQTNTVLRNRSAP
jgi:quercetin dioxygenase-like cupin family protein